MKRQAIRMIDVIAYISTVIGIGGIAGAIERGTSPAAAVVCMAAGCVCMRRSYKNLGKGALRNGRDQRI